MDEIKLRYINRLGEYGSGAGDIKISEAQRIYSEICEEVYLESLSKLMDRKN